MSLKVEKQITWNGQQFSGYEIVGIEWIFRGDIFYVLTEYFWNAKTQNIRKVIKHEFKVSNDVNVDEMINKVHKLHE
jgi:hypothetical protein